MKRTDWLKLSLVTILTLIGGHGMARAFPDYLKIYANDPQSKLALRSQCAVCHVNPAGGGGTQRLTRLVGEGRSMQMILTGEMIDAAEAQRIGLVNEVHPLPELREKTLALATRIASKSPIALAMAKAAVKSAARTNLREGLDLEIDLFSLCFSSEDKDEGVRAFLEKRQPDFKGR